MKTYAGRSLMVFVLAMAWCLVGFTAPAPAQKFGNFVNKKFGFATQLPNHWVSEVKDNSLIFSGPKNTEEYFTTINFQFINRKPKGSLEAQGKDLEQQWARGQNYKLLSREKIRVGGQPALRLKAVYKLPTGKETFQQDQVVVERGRYYYHIGYTAPQELFGKYKWAFDHVLKSFKFLPAGK